MKHFLSFFIILLAVILQTSFFPHIRIHYVIPNLFLVVLISWVILKKTRRAYFWAFFGGLLLDLFTETLYGISALSFLLVIFCISFVIKNFINVATLTSKIFIVFLSTLIYNAFFIVLLYFAKLFELSQYSGFLSKERIYFIIVQIILNSILVFPVLYFIKVFNNFIVRYEERKKARVF